jgi:hypothetical protein
MKMALKFVEPHLNKIPAWLKSMAQEYQVDECFLVIKNKFDEKTREEKPVMIVWGKKNGKLVVCMDKDGKEVEYGIGSLFGYMGDNEEDDED